MIDTLINKDDSFELIRDTVAQILADETINQQQLAIDSGEDPTQWAFKVTTERTFPWEQWLSAGDQVSQDPVDLTPIVNVWFETESADLSRTSVQEQQGQDGTFNIDVYAPGVSTPNGSGHISGDEAANRNTQRVGKLVRNIIMAAEYTYLNLQGTVGRRYVQGLTAFQPQIDARPVTAVQGVRVALNVKFNEYSPQITPTTLDCIHIDLQRTDDGFVLAQLEVGSGCV